MLEQVPLPKIFILHILSSRELDLIFFSKIFYEYPYVPNIVLNKILLKNDFFSPMPEIMSEDTSVSLSFYKKVLASF